MKKYKGKIISTILSFVLVIFCVFEQVKAQDLIETKLKKTEIAYHKRRDKDTTNIYFDRYNCKLHIDYEEIEITDVSITYRYSEDFKKIDSRYGSHLVDIFCLNGKKCIYTTLAKRDDNNPGGWLSIDFNNKKDAINFLNMLNDFVATAKQAGFCQTRK